MKRQKTDYTEIFNATMKKLPSPGLLLGVYMPTGKANIMTIGWCTAGFIWGMPVFSVLVRPSRYTYQGMEYSGCFTVNVPSADMNAALAVCGSKSGRDIDKFAACNLTQERAQNVLAPSIAECPIVYECQVVHSNDILPEKLSDEIMTSAYNDGDYHRVYFGKIIATYAAPNASELL
ncbi:MAG TPA: flavin reductase family protein [Phycisphaerae bacterium]|nr:flavin reductase family protein [Phycisphaerae bacterium]HPS52284.1 flavin reductase family protein [Phycisphaerae bacterium]